MIPANHNSDSFGYNEKEVGGTLDSWASLFDSHFSGHVALISDPDIGFIDAGMAAKAAGKMTMKDLGDPTKKEIDDLTTILKDLKKAGHFKAFWSTFQESVTFMQTGAVVVESMWSPAVTLLQEAQFPVRYAAKAPRSGIERFASAWIARWLQKSVRSILSRPQPTPKGARRADDERDAAAASWTGKRIRFALRARVRNAARNLHERARRSTRREPSIEPMEGAPDHDASALNQRGPSDPRPHRQNRAPRTSARLGRRRARSAPPKHRCGDTGRQRSRRLVRLPQPKGAGGQPAAVKGIRSRR
jgi:hypothetical protein